MGNKSSPALTLSLLVITALCLEASVISRYINISPVKRNWTEARSYCQRKHVDLITLEIVNMAFIGKWLDKEKVSQAWMGLHRDPLRHSVWKWINIQ